MKDKLRNLRTLTPLATLEPLYDLAAMVPADEAIVELGTYRGASACWLAAGAQSGLGAHVWTIDPHDLPGYRTTTGRGRGGLDFTDPAIRLDAERPHHIALGHGRQGRPIRVAAGAAAGRASRLMRG